MLIKEYRIPLPLTVEEYRIAQLYMIAKKSREESEGEGSGVEILVNEPYTDGPGGAGQYTHKIFHVGSHLPGWLKALLPKSAFIVEEKAWNAYPYTRTRYTCPFVEKFSLDIETVYKEDSGDIENVFKLNGSELNERAVDVIDVVKDQLNTAADYVKEEDPCIYVSRKTGRGPLSDSWIQEYWRECKGKKLPLPNGKAIMCAYKLCRVEFKYWGMQAKIERFIHEIALRKTMVRAHRQAWTWQDEWFNLTMEDIREIERQTQAALAQKMGSANSNNASFEDSESLATTAATTTTTLAAPPLATSSTTQSQLSPVTPPTNHWPISCISESSSDEDEFFDCQELRGSGALSPAMVRWSSMELVPQGCDDGDELEPAELKATEEAVRPVEERDSIFSPGYLQRYASANRRPSSRKPVVGSSYFNRASPARSSSPSMAPGAGFSSSALSSSNPANALILVFHGGTVLDSSPPEAAGKAADLATFRASLEVRISHHFMSQHTHIMVLNLVKTVTLLDNSALNLSPFDQTSEGLSEHSSTQPPSSNNGNASTAAATGVAAAWPPLGCLPLFLATSPDYAESVARTVQAANQAYAEFLKSPEGAGFAGSVAVVGDAAGSILLYDALCKEQEGQSRFGSENSIAEDVEDALTSTGPEEFSNTMEHHQPSLVNRMDHSLGGSASFRHRPHHHHHLHPQAPPRRSSASAASNLATGEVFPARSKSYLDFEVGDCFLLGSPLALVLAFRKWSHSQGERGWIRPHCHGLYNLFHLMDPLAARLEPLLSARFAHTRPVSVPRYQRYPLGDGKSTSLADFVQNNPHLFQEMAGFSGTSSASQTGNGVLAKRRQSDGSYFHVPRYQRYPLGDGKSTSLADFVQNNPHLFQEMAGFSGTSSASQTGNGVLAKRRQSDGSYFHVSQRWWGTKRLDYVFYCPEGLTSFPPSALPHLLHASFWESMDVAAFILRHLMRLDGPASSAASDEFSAVGNADGGGLTGTLPFSPSSPCEKWMRKRTSVKIKNIGANHRANDIIINDSMPQVIVARFMYGPLDMVALSGERVDVHFLRDATNGEWDLIASEVTDKTGRLVCTLPDDRTLPQGLHPIKMVVRGDHTYVDLYVAVLPVQTQVVVFSIDGSFTASVSVTGRDPKVRAGAVDVVRHWQELGYLIVYITGRPDMQQRRVVSWLAQHNFPHGLLSFADGLSTDPLRHKAEYLKMLVNDVGLDLRAAYGSSKDIGVYSSVGLKPDSIYIVGKIGRKQQGLAQSLSEGYASHLASLAVNQGRPAQINPYLLLPRGCLSLPGHGAPLLRRRSAKRATSFPISSSSSSTMTSTMITTTQQHPLAKYS
nr:EOG090X00NX [Eurycercus lamellatus]